MPQPAPNHSDCSLHGADPTLCRNIRPVQMAPVVDALVSDEAVPDPANTGPPAPALLAIPRPPIGGRGGDQEEKKGEAVVGAQRLVFVHLLAPLVAVPISAMAAIVVFAWFYTETLLGDSNEESGVEFRCFLFVVCR